MKCGADEQSHVERGRIDARGLEALREETPGFVDGYAAHAAAPWAASWAAWCSVVSASVNSFRLSPEITWGNL